MNDTALPITETDATALDQLTLQVNEIFYSIQGESTRVGEPCVFIRLKGCHLRCHYCDTEYAFHDGQRQTVASVIEASERMSTYAGHACSLYEITGGEPLLQKNVHALMRELCDRGRTVMVETSGALDVSACDPRVIRVMDFKTPGSGEAERNIWANAQHLTQRDEVKFVICDRADFDWACDRMREHALADRAGTVLMSPVHHVAPGEEVAGMASLPMHELADWVLESGLPIRMQAQLHKQIWEPTRRGV